MAYSEQLKEIIASVAIDKFIVDVIKFSHSAWDPFYITTRLETGTEIVDEDGITQTVDFFPMEMSDESQDGLIKNERTITAQGFNDVIAYYEDLIDPESEEKIQIDIYGYISNDEGVLSNVEIGPYTYYLKKTSYSQQHQACVMTVSTTPTNLTKTGRQFTKTRFSMLAGFDK